MLADEVLSAVKAGDRTILARAPGAGRDVLGALAAAMPTLEDEQRDLVVSFIARSGAPGSGDLLLDATDDPDLMVASGAALALQACAHPPPLDAVLKAIPSRPVELVRGALYRVAGQSREPGALARTKEVADAETSPEAAPEAIAAVARLGGPEEQALFFEALRSAETDQAMKLREQLFYIGVASLAKGMLPWLDDDRPVARLGFDSPEGPPMARMRDVAVWTADGLGIQIVPKPGRLREYPPDVVLGAREALVSLPDPAVIRSSRP